MRASTQELPVIADLPPIKVQGEDWGEFETQILTYKVDTDLGPLLQGLPDNRCQCAHWGYVIKGNLRVIYADHEEELNTGDLFFMSPSHSPIIKAGTEMLQFTPRGEALDQVSETIQRNIAAMQAKAGAHS